AIEPRVLNLNAVVQNIERMLRRLIGEDIEFRTVLEAGAGNIRADACQLEQVIMNLTVNARDAMPNGGKVMVTTRNLTMDEARLKDTPALSPGKYVMLAIADTG